MRNNLKMIRCCIVGASGYTGAELVKLIKRHPKMQLDACFVSENSDDANKSIGLVHAELQGICDIVTQPINTGVIASLADEFDAIFLATPHEASHDWADDLAFKHAKVFDLSGAFRLSDVAIFKQFYGFEHSQPTVLQESVYGLAEWNADIIKTAKFVAIPGCYPTASLLAIKPLMVKGLIAEGHYPIINATSGVSGAGKKLALGSHFCSVSLQAYGVLGHRHTPEINEHAGADVIFTPHLGQYKRGILATVTMKLKRSSSESDVVDAFQSAYADKAMIRLKNTWPKIDDVAHTAFCDIAWKYDANSHYLVVSTAIDNLLKGAASQAIQCANLAFGFESSEGLL